MASSVVHGAFKSQPEPPVITLKDRVLSHKALITAGVGEAGLNPSWGSFQPTLHLTLALEGSVCDQLLPSGSQRRSSDALTGYVIYLLGVWRDPQFHLVHVRCSSCFPEILIYSKSLSSR